VILDDEKSRGKVKCEGGKAYVYNPGVSKWSDVYWVRKSEMIQQGQSEVYRGMVKCEGGKAYVYNPGISKWSDVYWVRRSEVIQQGQSEVSRGMVKCEGGKAYVITRALVSELMCIECGEVK
jgi:hypothetical protein